MEVVMLHEQLRDAFSPVLKTLRPAPPANAATTTDTAAADNVGTAPSKKQQQSQSALHKKAAANAGLIAPTQNGEAAPSPSASNATNSSTVHHTAAHTKLLDPPLQIDPFQMHSLAIVHRLNTYQYATRQAFCEELTCLALLAHSPERQRAMQELNERVLALETLERDTDVAADATTTVHRRQQQVIGGLAFDLSASVPGLQEVPSDGGGTKWLCSVSIQHQTVVIGTYLTRANALKAYELYCLDLHTTPDGAAGVFRRAEELAAEQQASDARLLASAAKAIHPRLAWQRVNDMVSLTTVAVEKDVPPTTPLPATPSKPVPQLRASVPSKSVPSKSIPSKSIPSKSIPSKSIPSKSVPSKSVPSKSVPSKSTPNKTSASKAVPNNASTSKAAAAAELLHEPSPSPSSPSPSPSSASGGKSKRKKPAHRIAHLRLRRLVQMKLCPHLRGQEVCVVRRTGDEDEKIDWTPTGRLEAGKVHSYALDKLVTFADFVSGDSKQLVSACPHIFVVATRESIDSHLKDCSTFSDAYRVRLGEDFAGAIQAYMLRPDKEKQLRVAGSKSSSRRR